MIIILEKFKRWSLLYGRNGFSQCHQFVCKLVKDGGLEIYMSANPAINLLSYRLRSGCPRLRYITFHMERGERLRPNESFIYANTNNPLDGLTNIFRTPQSSFRSPYLMAKNTYLKRVLAASDSKVYMYNVR